MTPSRPQPRAELLALADQLPDHLLALVTAPAGSGRSTLLEAWRERLERASRTTAWLELGARHDEAGTLQADLVAAIAASGLPLAPERERSVAALADDPRQAAWLLARALGDRAQPRFLFLDDYHALVPGGPGAALLDALVDAAPPALHLVLSTRGPVPPATARMRARDRLLEVGTEELLLHAAEVGAVLTRYGVDPEPDLVAPLLAQTEGWATGVVLAARLLARRPPAERRKALEELLRAPDLVAWFAAEVLGGERPETLAVLEAAALLGRASASDVAAAAGVPVAHVDACIEQGLVHASGAVVALPGLWSSLLRERIGSDPDAGARSRRLEGARRALLAAGRAEDALELAAAFGEIEVLAPLLEQAGLQVLALGRRESVRRWLDRLPAEVRAGSPELLRLDGLAWLDLDTARAERSLRAAVEGFRARGDARGERRAVGALMQLCLGAGRMNEAMALARTQVGVLRLLRDPAARGDLLTALAGRDLLAHRFTRSLRLSERAVRHPLAPDGRWLNAMNRILLHVLRGELRRALRIADEALADHEVAMHVLPAHALRVLRALPQAALGDVEGALREGDRALDALRGLGFPRSFVASTIGMAGVHLTAGNRARARALLSEAIDVASQLGHEPALAMARAERAFVLALDGDPGAADEAEAAHDAFVRTSARRNEAWPWLWARALWAMAASGSAARAWDEARQRERELLQPELPLVHHSAALALADVARRAGAAADAVRLSARAWETSARAGLERTLPELPEEVVLASAREAFATGASTDHVLARLLARDPRVATRFLEEAALEGEPASALRAVEQMGRIGDRAFHPVLRTVASRASGALRGAADAAIRALDPLPRYRLRFRSLGAFRAWRDEGEIGEREWRGQTARRLLFRLLLAEGRPVPRDRLMEDLWPGVERETARTHLRVALSRLNDALEPDRPEGTLPHFVRTEGDTLAWNADARSEWDAQGWDRHAAEALELSEGREAGDDVVPRLAEALGAYGGRLLPDLRDDLWLDPLRQRLAERFAAVGRTLADAHIAAGRLDAADAVASRLLEEDPADEAAWALRMRVRLARGERTAALRLYATARETLRRELDLEPGDALRALAEEAEAGG